MYITPPRFSSGITLSTEHMNLRPDGYIADLMVEHFQKQPQDIFYVNDLSEEVMCDDSKGKLHWFTFGRKLIERLLQTSFELVQKQPFVVLINRQSTYQPERNNLRAFTLTNPTKHSPTTKLDVSDFTRLDKESALSAIKDAHQADVNRFNSKDFAFAVVPMTNESLTKVKVFEKKLAV